MAAALETFVKQLTDSGIIAPGKLENFIPPKAAPKDAQELARQLVQSKQLTKYQAQEIYAGRAKSLILGNYTILDRIGAGGMGQVFKAEHRRMKRLVAIKMLPKAVTKDAVAVARFQREVEAAAKLRHPNVVAADDADEAGGVHFLVMEYVEGSDLSALVKKQGPVSASKAVNYILQAARGLEFAHKKGVVHRDIKPANLLLDKEGGVKILDMGLARIESGGETAAQAELTGTGTVMGTVDYMAPEQALSTKRADARSDIYSLGCTLYYLVSGKCSYQGDSLMEKLLAHREQPIPSLRAAQPEISADVEAVYQKMVAKKPEDRYQTMSEIVALLEACGSGQSAPSIQRPPSASISAADTAFLRESSPRTKPIKPVKQAGKRQANQGGRRNNKLIFGVVGAALLGLPLLAALVVKLQTKDGTLVVEVDQPDATVQVDEGKVEITGPGEKASLSISVDPGKHRLRISKAGFSVYAQEFSLESGGKTTIQAKLERAKPAATEAISVRGPSALTLKSPSFQQWLSDVAALPAEKQVAAVAKKLQELNPGFDGRETHVIQKDAVVDLKFVTDSVTDISPVRALTELRVLAATGSGPNAGKLTDLAPLNGMHLKVLYLNSSPVTDLSPLAGMQLTQLDAIGTPLADLSPLKGMPLGYLHLNFASNVSDLGPLRGMPLVDLNLSHAAELSDLSPLVGMKLIDLDLNGTKVADLSPLKGMPLKNLRLVGAPVADLTPLAGMTTLANLSLYGSKVTQADLVAFQKTNPNCRIEWPQAGNIFNSSAASTPSGVSAAPGKPALALTDPAFRGWLDQVAALPAEKQVEAVVKKLQELNPGFDGRQTHTIQSGAVVDLKFLSDSVTDISPVRALPKLAVLFATGSGNKDGKLTDLAPLQGMQITTLCINGNPVSDLSPLLGMPLLHLDALNSSISDLGPLRGMPLQSLHLDFSRRVSDVTPLKGLPLVDLNLSHAVELKDLSPLVGMRLTDLDLNGTKVSDLAPLKGMPLRNLRVLDTPLTDLTPLAGMTTLTNLSLYGSKVTEASVAAFHKSIPNCRIEWPQPGKFFGSPAAAVAPGKPALALMDPAFQRWVDQVSSLPAEKQVEAVAKKLRELNTGFDENAPDGSGKITFKIKDDVVTDFGFPSENVSNISPVRALVGLVTLYCDGRDPAKCKLTDLSPLQGMKLGNLYCHRTNVSDLSPLAGMPLASLGISYAPVADLSPLGGLPLRYLDCQSLKNVSDVSPLAKCKDLIHVKLSGTKVTAASQTALQIALPNCKFEWDAPPQPGAAPQGNAALGDWIKATAALRDMKRLRFIRVTAGANESLSPAEFWKKQDAGEFR